MLCGAHGEIRTHGLKIRNFALYPAELRGHSDYGIQTTEYGINIHAFLQKREVFYANS